MPDTTTATAYLDIVTPGCLAGVLEVLSIGKGDLKLTVGGDDPEEIAKARRVIEEMLKAGYSIFVETDAGLRRVKQFNPKRMTYIVADPPPEPETAGAPVPEKPPKRGRRKSEVPVGGSRATAVGRMAGG